MKGKIKKLVINFFSLFKIKNVLVFESHADYGDNSRAIFDYLVDNGYNKKYKLYWFVNDENQFKDKNIANAYFMTMWHNKNKRTIWQWIKYFHIVKNAKILISSNRNLPRLNKKTITVNVNHGSPIKSLKDLNLVPKDINYYMIASDFFVDVAKDEVHLDENQILCVGNPRNDIMFKKTDTKNKFKEFKEYQKIVLWLPTFRQQSTSNRVDSNFDFPLGLPVIYNVEDLKSLNEHLKKNKTLLLFKLHPIQDVSKLKAESLSNIKIINDNYLREKDVDLCEFYKVIDALITDYSSVYYDFLQLDKPVGFTLDDYDDYKKTKGFIVDNMKDYMAGEKIYNMKELYNFFDDLANNKDNYKKQRGEMKKLFHKYSDDKSSKRFVEFFKI